MSDTTTDTTPAAGIEAAEREASEAAALHDALEARILDGDDTIGPDELERAKGLARFAKLRVQAAHRKSERLEDERRQAALAALLPELDQLVERRAKRLRAIDETAGKIRGIIAGLRAELEAESADLISLKQRLTTEAGVPTIGGADAAPEDRIYLDMGGRRVIVDGQAVVDHGEIQGSAIDDILRRVASDALSGL